MSSNKNEYSNLKELDKSRYEIAPGESDIRGWVVKNENGNILGEVNDLIFDTHAKKVRFLVLDMDRNELNLKERKVMLPIEYADIHEAYKNVVFKGLMPNELAALPTYEKGKITRNFMDITMSTFIASRNRQPENQNRNQDADLPIQNRVDADKDLEARRELEKKEARERDLVREKDAAREREMERERIARENDVVRKRNIDEGSDVNDERSFVKEGDPVGTHGRNLSGNQDFANFKHGTESRPAKEPETKIEEDLKHQKAFGTNTDAENSNRNVNALHTAIGVFEHPRQTQAAVAYLLDHGYNKNEIRVSSRHPEHPENNGKQDESSITHFFRSLFNNDDDARRYSDAAGNGSVVTVDVTSAQKAEEAADILDQLGCMNIDSDSNPQTETSANRRKRNSRILERRNQR